jgi:hypothetical protein
MARKRPVRVADVIDLGTPEPIRKETFDERASVSCLVNALETHRERAHVYGRNDKMHGMVMAALFPDGAILVTAADHARFGLVTQLVSKLTRYATNFTNGGHGDSMRDMVVYAAMLEGMDMEIKG